MNNWRYEYDCRNCTNKEIVDGAEFCIPLRALRHPTHDDDDFVCRCDEYRPGQISMDFVTTANCGADMRPEPKEDEA